MSQSLLLPNRFKIIGWLILVPATVLGVILIYTQSEAMQVNSTVFAMLNQEFLGNSQYFTFIRTDITDTIVGILFIAGALLVCFSQEKREDEFIAKLRQSSLLWAVLANYILLLFSFVFIYGEAFLQIMVYNMFTVLIIFIVRFNYVLYRSKAAGDEKHD